MYDRLEKGWMAICLLAAGLIALGALLAFAFTGERPLLGRLMGRSSRIVSEEPVPSSGDT